MINSTCCRSGATSRRAKSATRGANSGVVAHSSAIGAAAEAEGGPEVIAGEGNGAWDRRRAGFGRIIVRSLRPKGSKDGPSLLIAVPPEPPKIQVEAQASHPRNAWLPIQPY